MQWNEFRSHIGHFSARQQQRVHEAFELGKKMHEGQARKSGDPYFTHPIAVAHMLADMGVDPDTIIAALLHDTIEDTPLTLSEIETAFGSGVSALIEGVTKLSKADVEDRPNLDEQIETLRKIFTLMEKDIRIMVIKLIDRLHNMQTANFVPPKRQHTLAQETLDVYAKIADRLCMQVVRDELEGLCLAILEPENSTKLTSLRAQSEIKAEEVIKLMRQKNAEQPAATKGMEMLHEFNTWDKLREQLRTEGTVVTGVSGLTVVFVGPDVDACYRTLGFLHQLWKREAMSFQDFINAPTVNGYRGLHTTVILEDGTRVRCKIRTKEMHDYARRGIVLYCFRGRSPGFMEYLPWTTRISPLSQDTEGSSNEFWATLQSDILGESIVIHGPADQSVSIPKGSTALDGAFYLFRDEALKLTSISIAGKDIPFPTPLQHAASLNVTIHTQPTVERKWLEWTKTGFATAIIRSALAAGKTEAEKTSLGKELLQRTLSDHRKGFIEEFDEQSLQHGLLSLGYPRMESLYVAIADGHIEPGDAYAALFEQHRKISTERSQYFHVSYKIDTTNTDVMDRLNDIHRKYRRGLNDIRYKRGDPHRGSVTLKGHLTRQEQRDLIADLTAIGGGKIRLRYAESGQFFGIAILICLWGLDPVVAALLLHQKISSVDLTITRFLTFWSIAAVIYAIQWMFSRQKFKPLNPFHPDLILCGLALFATALSTYVALARIGPTQYIIFIIGGVVLSMLLRQRSLRWPLLSVIIMLAAILLTLSMIQDWSPVGFLMAAVSATGFALYSGLSKRYQEEKVFIRARYPAYLFWISTLGLLCTSLLLPYSTFARMDPLTINMAVLFSFLFTILPYILYFELMRRIDVSVLNRSLPFVCVATLLGEIFVTRSFAPLIALSLLPLFIWFYRQPAKQ